MGYPWTSGALLLTLASRGWRTWIGGAAGGVHAVIEGLNAADVLCGGGAIGRFVGIVVAGEVALGVGLDDDAVGAGIDDEIVVEDAVREFGLGEKPSDLAAYRHEGAVAKEGAGGVAGAVEEDGFRERGEIGGGVELAGDQAATGALEVLGELVRVTGDVEAELGTASSPPGRKGVGAGREVLGNGVYVLEVWGEPGEVQRVSVAELPLVGIGVKVREVEAVDTINGRVGLAEKGLVVEPGGSGHLLPLGGKGRWHRVREGDAGVRGEGAGCAEGTGVAGPVLGVDGDGTASGALGGDSRRKAEGAAAEDGKVSG